MSEKEYIERGAFWRNLELAPDYWIKGRTIKAILDEQPAADVVEVVRCCDCKYCETVIHSVIDEPKWFCTRMVRAFDVDPTSFCSYGERKEQT